MRSGQSETGKHQEALIIFAKNPEAGKVKTRLAATIGDEAALIVYHRLLFHTATVTGELAMDKFVFYSEQIIHQDIWENKLFFKQIQKGNDLGERMENAFEDLFDKGYDKIVIIGTDCPVLTTGIITSAFTCLDTHNVVIGPAGDGGYYLLGMKQMHVSLFQNIPWSTNTVLVDTMYRCDALKLNYASLSTLNDIDVEKDLIYFEKKTAE